MTASKDTIIVNTACAHDCGGRCVLKAHVRDGQVIRIETDNGPEPQLRACLRGRAYRQRLSLSDRLLHPMRRVGQRGEGRFERISWDEALDTVARELLRIRQTYGNASILFLGGGGSAAVLHSRVAVERMLGQFGGYTTTWGSPSFEGALFASMATYGTMTTGNAREDLLNSRLIIMWGWNPAATVWDPNTALWLARAHEKGIPTVAVDPRLTQTAAVFADEWVPIRPCTDAAMLIAMAHVIISEGLQDQPYIDRYTIGFDRYRDYVLGKDDGVARTPGWAESITGVPAASIVSLARRYATMKPAALIPGWGPARTAMGEQYSRAAMALAAITGNVGIPGGYAGGFMRPFHSREMGLRKGMSNPVEETAPLRRDSLYRVRGAGKPTAARVHRLEVWDAVLKGRAGGYPADLRLGYIATTNVLNSNNNTNRGMQALRSLEFVVVHEQRMTPTARFADILLPVNTFMEREDATYAWLGSPYYLYINKAVDAPGEAMSDRDICAALAPRLGLSDPREGKSDQDWLRDIARNTRDIVDFDKYKRDGVFKINAPEPFVAFRLQIEDPTRHPFPTASGKIEIHCAHLDEWQNPLLPGIPKFISPPEGCDDPGSKQYPLQLLTTHLFGKTHSTLEKVPWLEEAAPRRLMMNTLDAASRGIADGDEILVFNGRGKVSVRATVTERIMPGVVDLPQGGWSEFDANGVDRGGCANVLTSSHRSPGGAFSCNTVLVQVARTG